MDLTFAEFDNTRSHWWWRPGWGPGVRYLTFHLTFEGAEDLHDAVRTLTTSLSELDAVDPVPEEWLHMTMTGLGFADDIDDSARDAVAEAVFTAAGSLTTRPLRFGRAYVHREGLGFSANDADWLRELRRIQLAAVGTVRDTAHDSAFRPHVTAAYFSGAADAQRVGEVARALRAEQIVVAHPRLSLIELGRDDQVYTWRVLRQMALG